MARSQNQVLTERLASGLPVAYRWVPGSVECCGVAIMAGSRDEALSEWGLAHFVEHTIFKGTGKRKSYHVINRMETVGGELNAYTTKEETFVYATAPAYNTARAVELIADLVINSTFPAAELDKEREVVADEISSYLDAPDAAVCDDYEDLIFKDSQLGHNILGTRRSVARLTGEDCRRWVSRHYHAGRMAFFYTGPVSFYRVMALAHRYLESIPAGDSGSDRIAPRPVEAFDLSKSIHSHQAHTVMGNRLDNLSIREYDPLGLMNNILGGPGMNSRLNVSLRERRGLVYTVDSSVSRYSDCVLWTVYFGCDDEHTELCRHLVSEAVEQMAAEPMSDRSLAMAKRQFLGQLTLSRAGVENSALALGRCTLRGEPFRSPDVLAADIRSVSAADLRNIASRLITTPLSSLTFR